MLHEHLTFAMYYTAFCVFTSQAPICGAHDGGKMTRRKFAPDSEARPPAATLVMTANGMRRVEHRPERRGKLIATEEMIAEVTARIEEEAKRTEEERARAAAERVQRLADLKQQEERRKREALGADRKGRIKPPLHLGQPTIERRAKARDGFDEQNLAPPGAPEVVRAAESTVLAPPEAARRKGILDRALDDGEAYILFRYLVGTLVADRRMRLKVGDDGDKIPTRSNPAERLPFNEAERLEIGARHFVYSRLPPESRHDLDVLLGQLVPNDDQQVMTPVEFGKKVAKSTDERVAKGAYIGTFRKLTHHLTQFYVEWEMDLLRRRKEAKAVRRREGAEVAE